MFLASALCLAAGWLFGCAKKPGQEAATEMPDTLSTTADTLPETPDTLSVTYDTLTDKRDGKIYKMVKMPDGKTWMAQNLNYQTDSSWCYGNADSNCVKYGRLYNWNTAKTACHSGWHLPTTNEWDGMVDAVGGKTVTGKKLKSTTGWNNSWGNGTDAYGFSALSGGYRSTDGNFNTAGGSCDWWSATEGGAGYAYGRGMYCLNDLVFSVYGDKSNAFSVRCVRD
jgi:uncharacterized protein (TIGR02145 family)